MSAYRDKEVVGVFVRFFVRRFIFSKEHRFYGGHGIVVDKFL
jgi:hypothetical protein